MLTQLIVQNFLLIETLTLNFSKGLTLFTGETGAGKSILFEALGFLLGARSHVDLIQQDKTSCIVSAQFDIQALPEVQNWLKIHLLENQSACVTLKRTLSQEGKSQGWINEKPVSIKQLKTLGALLITVHSQHSQQELLKLNCQQGIVDRYGQHDVLLQEIQQLYQRYVTLTRQARDLETQIQFRQDQAALLQYQVEELELLGLQTGEWEQLSQEQRQLSQAEHLLDHGHQALNLLDDTPHSALAVLNQVKQQLQKFCALGHEQGENLTAEIEQALVHVTETRHVLHRVLDTVNLDPERLALVEQRLSKIHEIARKHGVTVEALPDFFQRLQAKNQRLRELDIQLSLCQKAQADCISQYQILANDLTKKRQHTKTQLATLVSEKIQNLGMEGALFEIELIPVSTMEPNAQGQEHVEFYLCAAHGQARQRLSQSASGGELSRISLVINAQIAEKNAIPSMILDEVDVGMSGGVAERVGRLLRDLALTKQVFCVTHQPQVAVFAHTHYRIYKQLKNTEVETTLTQIEHLVSTTQRIHEIARMLGGIYPTPQTLKLAQEFLLSHSELAEAQAGSGITQEGITTGGD